jgi:taurine dioxygenase
MARSISVLVALSLLAATTSAASQSDPYLGELGIAPLVASGGFFGAEVTLPADLSGSAVALPASAVEGIREALAQHSVLVFRGLGHRLSTLAEHVAFCRQFGVVDPEVSRAPRYCTDGGVHVSADTKEIKATEGVNPFGQTIRETRLQQLQDGEPPEVFKVVTHPNDGLAFGEGFHTDLTFLQSPPSFGVAVMRTASAPGTGDTLFLSMAEAYSSLAPANRSRIESLWGMHDDKDGRSAVHPVVRVVGNQTVLFVNGHFTRALLPGPPGGSEDSDNSGAADVDDVDYSAILSDLNAHIEAMEPLRVQWSEQDLVMWDERTTQHAAVHDYFGQHRRLDRVLVSGDVPVGL